MVLENEEGRPYYYRNRLTGQSSSRKPKAEHDLSALGFGLALGNEAIWIALDELSALENPVPLNLGGSSVRIFHNTQAMTAWAQDESGNLLGGVLAYKEGWLDFHPESKGLSGSRR